MEQIGIDEAGVGTLAGPLVVAIVVLPMGSSLPGVKDSKKMTDATREALIDSIYATAEDSFISYAEVYDIDQYGVWNAWDRLCVELVMYAQSRFPDRKVLVDGVRKVPEVHNTVSVVHGDSKHLCISAASVLAKYGQCLHMDILHKVYPMYGFDKHRGYASAEHIEAIKEYGAILNVHRKKYVETLASNKRFKLKWKKK